MRPTAFLSVFVLAAFAVGCRDGASVFTPQSELPVNDSLVRLTFSMELDRSPAWSAGSDTVYYSAAHPYDHPSARNTLLKIARKGSPADLLVLGNVPRVSTSLVLPVPSPTHDRIAYVDLFLTLPPAKCEFSMPADTANCNGTEPLLEPSLLRVRPVSSTTAPEYDVSVTIPFEGVDPARSRKGALTYEQHEYPYQLAFTRSNDVLFRPSWSPDGSMLVFSDGLELRRWNGVDSESSVIGNTKTGVSPAWSPVADRIAFVRMVVDDSLQVHCSCYEPEGPPKGPDDFAAHNRWLYHLARTVITLIDPDGANAIELTDGMEPAWSPDGKTIYFAKDNWIYAIPSTGGTPVRIEGTSSGRAPAVSPDGRWLAFARYTADNKDADIWVKRLHD